MKAAQHRVVFKKGKNMQTVELDMADQIHGGVPLLKPRFNSGTANGLRIDGNALGAGCGTVRSDAFIPDILFGIDISQACFEHDQSYATCGFEKSVADTNFFNNIQSDCSSQGGGFWACGAISSIYYIGVALLGGSAYSYAQVNSCLAGD
jgi:hypothetical protein